MTKFLVEVVFLAKTADFPHLQLIDVGRFGEELCLCILHIWVEEISVILSQVRSRGYFYLLRRRLWYFGLHRSDKLHEEGAVVDLFFRTDREGERIFVISLNEFPLKNLQGLNEWFIIFGKGVDFLG